ncbi:calcineurin-like phosphoesterase C-terminal domain-containing protein [Bacteroides sp.]
MNKQLIMAVILYMTVVSGYAATVTGVVKSAEKPLAEVLVTDGFSFTVTDGQGRYSIDLAEKAEFVYLLTPKGYVADYSSGTPQFYQRLDASKQVYNFNLQKMKGNPDHFVMIAMADTQLDTDSDVKRINTETLPDLKATAEKYPDAQVAGIILGDITWDVYKYNASIKDFAKQAGFPIYPVIGNHDFDKYVTPDEGTDFAHIYKKEYGPLYYALQLGNVYYIILNDIEYYGNKRYKTTLEMQDQMKWLELLLNCVLQQNKKVYIAMHAPLKPVPERPLIPGGEQLKKMLVNKFHASILTGHFHQNSITAIGGGIIEHNLGAACGNLWICDVCRDGTPNGYKVFEGKGSNVSWYYKSTGKDRNYQMKVYPKGRVMERPDAIVAKVWDWDEAWRVRWYEDGKFMGDMSQFYSYDPDYLEYLNGRRAVDDYAPARTNHYFSLTPSASAKEVRIEAEDQFGNVYSEVVNLK